ncbi:hypothetical protein EW146_g2129 [Bondarzewia mesenterica]|uniref:Uncharacterized protein n=1 Tax=Bondarzewia mesenterica TaxID=1095465 RepID=A0A4S4M3G3_9AGAM|nr:hypothetical protein EW146_g2129 [Bondarzewia mesenterica]
MGSPGTPIPLPVPLPPLTRTRKDGGNRQSRHHLPSPRPQRPRSLHCPLPPFLSPPALSEIAFFTSATDAFSQASTNIHTSLPHSFALLSHITARALAAGIPECGYVSVVTACPYTDPVLSHATPTSHAPSSTWAVTKSASVTPPARARPPPSAPCSTPSSLNALSPNSPKFHDNYGIGIGLANALTALSHDLCALDTSLAGLGGCPYSLSATGNLATEDFLHALCDDPTYTIRANSTWNGSPRFTLIFWVRWDDETIAVLQQVNVGSAIEYQRWQKHSARFPFNLPLVDIYGTPSASVLEDAVPSEWSSSKHGFHAISTVVNNPHKRSAPPKAHSAVPSVPPAELPRVRRKDFDPYLKAIGPEWDRFQKSVELGHSGEALIGEPSSSALLSACPRLTSITPRTPRITKSRTFNAVAETSSTASSSSSSNPRTPLTPFDPSALVHSLPLLEKLSHHADTLEQHLVHEIARRATSFFAALTNLQDLQAESARCLARIQSLRTQLQHVDKNVAIRGLEAVNLESRLGHLRRI